mmetsp:Transcript_8877/g.39289  ORF Transcript_8877/g.39289 Transcript_8877/m.39289 type:complete len:148 (-) Transcript_8877:2913-3356(-)
MMAGGGGLDLDFDRDEWDEIDDDREELTLQSLFHSTNKKLASTQGSQTSEGSESFFLPDEIILLVDFRESMATSVDEDGNGLLSSCLRCAAEVGPRFLFFRLFSHPSLDVSRNFFLRKHLFHLTPRRLPDLKRNSSGPEGQDSLEGV